VRTIFTNVSLPAVDNILPCHPGSLAPILSMRGCRSTFRNFLICSGRPKYFPRKLLIFPGKFYRRGVTTTGSTLIGKISVFAILTDRPEHSPKTWRIFCRLSSSVAFGAAKIAASSAYNEHLRVAVFGSNG